MKQLRRLTDAHESLLHKGKEMDILLKKVYALHMEMTQIIEKITLTYMDGERKDD